MTFILAHKGLSGSAPENTMPAYRSAMEIGADGFEADIQMTSDGVPVCSHSYTINSHSNGKGAIHDHTLDELRALDFGSWKGEEFKGTRIATLDECLSAVDGAGMANLELKTPFVRRREYIDGISACLNAHGIGSRAIITSFDHSLVSEFDKVDHDCGIGVLMLPVFKEVEEIIEIIGECYPSDVPLDSLMADDVEPLDDIAFVDEFLGVEGANPKDVFMSLGKILGEMFPGKTFGQVGQRVMSQSDVPAYLESLDFEPDYVFCHYLTCFMEPDAIRSMQDAGKKIVAWTVDSPEHAKRLLDMGADGLITDNPAEIVGIVGTKRLDLRWPIAWISCQSKPSIRESFGIVHRFTPESIPSLDYERRIRADLQSGSYFSLRMLMYRYSAADTEATVQTAATVRASPKRTSMKGLRKNSAPAALLRYVWTNAAFPYLAEPRAKEIRRMAAIAAIQTIIHSFQSTAGMMQ